MMLDLRIAKDRRPIESVEFPDGGGYAVGYGGVTRIEAYEEAGQMGLIPAIAIYSAEDEPQCKFILGSNTVIEYSVETLREG